MNTRQIYICSGILISVFFTGILFKQSTSTKEFNSLVKLSLRDVGDQLLRSNQDFKSLVLPVIQQDNSTYTLSFQKYLEIVPDSLISIAKNSFNKAQLPKNYRLEVIDCTTKNIVYSYQINTSTKNTIVPCRGRLLPKNCYIISLHFFDAYTSFSFVRIAYYIFVFGGVIMMLFGLQYKQRVYENVNTIEDYVVLGNFQFYPEEHKLVKQTEEISLSKKECELLTIFITKPNQIITRTELTKKVWEDNGVIVGRSLDTYISKLRKKLQTDTSIKLTNIHGVGYKLEIKPL
jgi:DNA-binding winged helix-turn-helix (wHTH) protein